MTLAVVVVVVVFTVVLAIGAELSEAAVRQKNGGKQNLYKKRIRILNKVYSESNLYNVLT